MLKKFLSAIKHTHLSRFSRCFAAFAILLLLAACSGSPAPASPTTADASPQPVIVPSELVVGRNSFAVGLIEPGKGPIKDARVRLRYFDLSNPSAPTLESEADAEQITTPDGMTAVYAHEREFKRAGSWGVEITARLANGKTQTSRVQFTVLASSATKKIGDPAPMLETPTAADVSNDLTRLTSATKPNPTFYQLSLAQALRNGKPTLLILATPAFCQTRFCGPAYDVASAVQQKYPDAFNWIHVEVYTDLPHPDLGHPKLAPAMRAFGVNTEPWIFVMDKSGAIVYRVEGLVTQEEIERHLKPLIGP